MGGFEAVLVKTPSSWLPGSGFSDLGEVERHYDNSYAVNGFMAHGGGGLVEEPVLDDTGVAVKLGSRVVVVAG